MTDQLKSFFAGWAGGAGLVMVGQPFDTIKTRMQATPELYKGAADCLKQTMGKEGPMALYRGAIPVLGGIGPVFALYFAAYDAAEAVMRKVMNIDRSQRLTMTQISICGGSTGVVGSLVMGPVELIKVLQQTATAKGKDASLRGVWKDVGVRGLTRGLGSTMARDVPASTAWFGAYELTKAYMCKNPMAPSTLEALFAGGMAGLANWLVCMPMDTVKTAIQSNTTGKKLSYSGAISQIFKSGGVPAFYRGIVPVLLRAFPANAACFATKEMAMRFFNQMGW